jgi:hypothetical protein
MGSNPRGPFLKGFEVIGGDRTTDNFFLERGPILFLQFSPSCRIHIVANEKECSDETGKGGRGDDADHGGISRKTSPKSGHADI